MRQLRVAPGARLIPCFRRMTDHPSSTEAKQGGNLEEPNWFCIRSQLKHEHIAAAHLRSAGHEVFLPRIRYKKATRRGPVWFNEALFPNYVFARFVWKESLADVMHTRGVSTVIHFGENWPVIADSEIAVLRELADDTQMFTVESMFNPGEEVSIAGGAFNGLSGVVQKYLPSRQRVAILLEFLGRQTQVEISPDQLVRSALDPRSTVI
jgi:transcriptional antiterminator RfaH